MFRIPLTNNIKTALAAHHLTIFADFLNRSSYFHLGIYLKTARQFFLVQLWRPVTQFLPDHLRGL